MRHLLYTAFILGCSVLAGMTFVANYDRNRAPVTSETEMVYPEFIKPPAPALTLGGCPRTVVVAVIDTGLDYTHPEIAPYVWGSKDVVLDGVDNDHNGFVDDTIGWDFSHDYRLPYDVHGHGTHIAGIIIRISKGILDSTTNMALQTPAPLTQCTPDVRIMALKYYNNSGWGYNNLTNTVKAIDYAVKNGANIINYSGGGPEAAESEKIALQRAAKAGILIVAASGNDGHNIDARGYFPASYKFSTGISVGSLSPKSGTMLSSSNFGLSVDLLAPGFMSMSYLPRGTEGTMTGTSQATAYVTGVAAVLMSAKQEATALDIKNALINSAQPYSIPGVIGFGILNPGAALNRLNNN